MPTSEYIVIGAGIAGASAAWRLAQRGQHVTLLERTTPANEWGSSHGSARIFRYAYPQELYAGLVVRSKSGWDELERLSGAQLMSPTGAVDFGHGRGVIDLAGVLDRVGVEHEVLSQRLARGRWPQLNFDSEVLWQPGAGVLDAETTVKAMVSLAEATGLVDVRTGWNMASVGRITGAGGSRSEGFTVRSATGETVTGKKVIVAAGGWLPSLLKDLSLPSVFLRALPKFEVRQEQAFHMPWRETDHSVGGSGGAGQEFPAWPTFIHSRASAGDGTGTAKGSGIDVYGLPGGRDAGNRGQKFARFNGGKVLPSALDQNGEILPEMRAWIIDYAREFLPGLVPEPYAETTCLFTNTPNEDFVIDEADGVIVLSACSGHGAKFAPLLGELAADLAMGTGDVPAEFSVAMHAAASVQPAPLSRH